MSLLCAGSATAGPPGTGDTQIDQARQGALGAELQPELPRYRKAGSVTARPDRRAGALDARNQRAMVDTRERRTDGPLASLMSFLLWGLVIVFGALGLLWLASELTKFGADPELPSEPADPAMSPAVAAIIARPLGDADELARNGEFAEAIHTLLLRTLQELVRHAAVKVAPATTSREILARVPLLADSRTALADLITAVELTHFGDEPANAADYERCRRQFHVFAQAFRGGRAA